MDENQPNKTGADDVDSEYEDIKGKIPGLEDSQEETQEEIVTPNAAAEEAEAAKKKEEEDAAAADEAKKKEEEEAAAAAAALEDDPADKPTRPEKYIPIKQYTSEKKEWKDREAQLLSDLEAAKTAKGSDKDDAIKAYAEKHGVSEESVRELSALFGSGDKKDEARADKIIDDTIEAELEEARELKAEKLFKEEYDTLALPELKKAYPNATPAQLEKARKEIEKIACTKDYLDKSLDFVVYKNDATLAPLFKAETRKGPETGRTAPKRGDTTYTAEDFKGGKTDFKELISLPVAEQTKIVENMDLDTYEAFTRFNDRNEELIINRGGRKVRS